MKKLAETRIRGELYDRANLEIMTWRSRHWLMPWRFVHHLEVRVPGEMGTVLSGSSAQISTALTQLVIALANHEQQLAVIVRRIKKQMDSIKLNPPDQS